MAQPQPIVSPLARFLPKDTTGFALKRNPNNGFVIVSLDYFADPEKRSPEWKKMAQEGLPPRRWAVEYERAWDVSAGRPIYADCFHRAHHVLAKPVGPNPGYPIFRGWDFGGNQSCAIVQVRDGHIYVLDEIPNGGVNTRQFAPEVIRFCNGAYGPDYHYIDIVDPSAMWEGKTAEGHACVEVMQSPEIGLMPIPAKTNDPEKRIAAVTKVLINYRNGKPTLLLNPHCEMLIKGFEFGYHFPERPTQQKKADKPVKNLYSHIHDALQYAVLRINAHDEGADDEEMQYEASVMRYKFGGK